MTNARSRRNFLRASSGALGAAALAHSLPGFAQTAQPATPELTRIDLGHASVIQGAGGNVFVLPGGAEDGAMIVDGGLAAHSEALINEVKAITGQDRIHTLINTHYHPEQTGSNERVGAEGGIIIAHEKTRLCLENAVMSATYEGRYGPLADAGLPTQLLQNSGTLKFAGQEIIYDYLPAAHTNGDIFLYFPILDTLVCGGPVTTDQWPIIDYRQGAWIGGLMRAYDKLAAVVSADTIVVPAHGPVVNGGAIIRMRNMYSELHLTLAEQLNLGIGWNDIVMMNPLKQFESQYGDAAYFLETAQRSLQMAYVPN